MINLTDSLSACTASGILAYAKQIYQQMSGGTATNVEDLLNEHEAKFDNQAEINAMTVKMDRKGNLSLGFGVFAQRSSFGFGSDSTVIYLTGNNKSYTATLLYNQGDTSGNSLFGDIFRSIFRGVYLLDYYGTKVAQITNASYDSDTQVITLTLDTDLGELNDQLYSLENVSGSYNFNAGVFGNKGGDSTCLGYVNMNRGDYSSLVGTTNSNSEDYSSLIGYYNRNDGTMGTVIGTYNTNKGDNSTVIGNHINFGENCTGSAVGSKINIYKGQNTGLDSGVSTAFALGSGLTLSHPSIALGRNNKDYDISGDTQNFFTLGCGEGENPLNLLEQSKNGNLFIKGVGNFDGTNSQSASTKSLQDVLDEIESGLQSAIKLNEYDEVNITHPIYEEGGVGSLLCNLVKDDDKIIQDHSAWSSEFADYVRNSHLYIGTNFGNSGIGVLENDEFLGYERGEEIVNVTDSNDKSTIANCIKSPHGYWIIQTESELTASDNLYSSIGNYHQKRDITPFRLEQNGSLYLMNVGGYNGDASTTHQSESLQEVISGISASTESKLAQTPNNSLELGRTNFVNNTSDSIAGGAGVNITGNRAFGYGISMGAIYLTGDEGTYSARLHSNSNYTNANIIGHVFATTHLNSYLLNTSNFSRVAQITNIVYNGENQPITLTLDTDLGNLTNAVYAIENVAGTKSFNGGSFGNAGQNSSVIGQNNFNTGNSSSILGSVNANTAGSATVLGDLNKNSGSNSNILGTLNDNTATYSNVIGLQNANSGQYSNIVGRNNNNKCANTNILGTSNIVNETTYPSSILGFENNADATTQQFTLGYQNHGTRGQYAQGNVSASFMFGHNLTTSSGCYAIGKYNKDYDVQDIAKQNFFVVGQGDSTRALNNLEVKNNGNWYVYGVGGFNGTNSDSATVKTLQAKIAELENAKALLNELNTKMNVLMDDMDVEAKFAYGVQWDKTATSPDCTRVGNMLLHAMLPVQSQMRGCLLNDNGEVVKYLAESGWTEETLDGSMGQVMVEIPEFYWKFTESGNTQTVMLSQVPIEGYTKVSKRYVSAYEATIDNNGNTGTTNSSQYKLASVKNTTARYRGCNNVASNDETYKSGLGMPRTNLSLQVFRESARRRKPGTYEWNCYDYMTHKILYWLFVVEFATRHTQKAFDSTTTISGYKTGGLGNGVTTVNNTEWTNLYGNYPIVPCGTSDSLGNGTGEVSYAVPSSGAGDTWTTVKVPRYRGIENPFGHIWKQTDGIKVEVEPGGTTSGESKVYVCYTPSNYNSTSDVANYNYIGNEERSQGNVKEIFFGPSGDLLTSVNGGGSNTYYGDYYYVTTDNTAIEYRSVRFGGSASYGASAGFVCTSSYYGLSPATTYSGSRLCFIPDAT